MFVVIQMVSTFVLCTDLFNQIYHLFIQASNLIGYYGYGPVAGFLFQKGVMGGNMEGICNDNQDIHPITGELVKKHKAEKMVPMTDDEKERESEKLFVLFERLNKTGVMKPITPEMFMKE